jgi:hypothetical protein
MLKHVKRILPFGNHARTSKFSASLQSRLNASPLLAMQGLTEWLNLPATRADIQDGGLELLQSADAAFRTLVTQAMHELMAASTNQAKTTLLLRSLVPYCALLRDIYAGLLSRDIVETARKGSRTGLIQSAVTSWLFWSGRCFFLRFVQDGRPTKLPWHEIQPTVSFALGLGEAPQTTETANDADDGTAAQLRRQLASLVLLSRSLSTDLQGRQLLIAERIAEGFADHTKVSTEHSANTPFGHANNDDNPPTVLSRLPTQSLAPNRGLFYGLDESVQELVRLDYQIKLHNSLPPSIDASKQLNVAEVLVVISHLRNRWSGQRIKRQAERRAFSGMLSVVHGVNRIAEAISPAVSRRPFQANPATSHEPAEIIDASLTGLGIKLTRHAGWIKVGQVIGLKIDSEPFWRIGMVRRAILTGHREMQAGVQLIGKAPKAVSLRRLSQVTRQTDALEMAPQQPSQSLFLRDETSSDTQGILISAASDLEVDASYDVTPPDGPHFRFRIGGIQELGSDCILYFGKVIADPAH